MTGYAHPAYARALSEFGKPLQLEGSQGWLLMRAVPGYDAHDAMGCYPLFCCADWTKLPADLDARRAELVSVVLVADPFGNFVKADLDAVFDVVRPFKQHYVVDCNTDLENAISAHHRYYARRSFKTVRVEACEDPVGFLDEWCRLYSHIVQRHDVRGIRAFSREAFAQQLEVPGISLFRAVSDGVTIGAQWYYIQGDVAYSHLTAMAPDGYKARAAYALQFASLQSLRRVVRWVDLGAVAGASSESDGLESFKRGWSTDLRPAYLCGKILNADEYNAIVRSQSASSTSYFPAYRAGEFS